MKKLLLLLPIILLAGCSTVVTLLADDEALRCRPSRRDGVRRHRCNSGKSKADAKFQLPP
jgi:uncharacterized protein YceK